MWKLLRRGFASGDRISPHGKETSQKRWSWGSLTSLEDGDELDRSKHRCSSVESLLSLERSELQNEEDGSNAVQTPVNETKKTRLRDDSDDAALLEACDPIGLELSEESLTEIEVSMAKIVLQDRPPENRKSVMKSSLFKPMDKGPKEQKNVHFGSVDVYEHNVEISGQAIPLRGPALGLGWKRVSHREYDSVDDHIRDSESIYHRSFVQLIQSPEERTDILLNAGYTLREIRASTRECGVIRTQRLRSARFSSRNKFFPCLPQGLPKKPSAIGN